MPHEWVRHLKIKAAEEDKSLGFMIRRAVRHFYDLDYILSKKPKI